MRVMRKREEEKRIKRKEEQRAVLVEVIRAASSRQIGKDQVSAVVEETLGFELNNPWGFREEIDKDIFEEEVVPKIREADLKEEEKTEVLELKNNKELSFQSLKEEMMQEVTLMRPQKGWQFVVKTDWSRTACGAVLCQVDPNDEKRIERPISYMSKRMSGSQLRYCATDGECLAILLALDKWRSYL
jgi:hypothetical protein